MHKNNFSNINQIVQFSNSTFPAAGPFQAAIFVQVFATSVAPYFVLTHMMNIRHSHAQNSKETGRKLGKFHTQLTFLDSTFSQNLHFRLNLVFRRNSDKTKRSQKAMGTAANPREYDHLFKLLIIGDSGKNLFLQIIFLCFYLIFYYFLFIFLNIT